MSALEFACPICGALFTSQMSYEQHRELLHDEDNMLVRFRDLYLKEVSRLKEQTPSRAEELDTFITKIDVGLTRLSPTLAKAQQRRAIKKDKIKLPHKLKTKKK